MEKPTKYVDDPSQSLCCPVCQRVFLDPVISVLCGHTFCRRCAEYDQENKPKICPIDQTTVESNSLVLNRAIQGQVDELQIYCCHALTRADSEEDFVVDDGGCPEVIVLGNRDQHEDSCEFALIPCPNGSNYCGKLRQKDLADHMMYCNNMPCPFKESGCQFRGQAVEVDQHKPTCGFRGIKVDKAHNAEVKHLRDICEQLVHTLRALTDKVSTLEEKMSLAQTQLKQQEKSVGDLHQQNVKLVSQVNELLARTNVHVGNLQTSSPIGNRRVRGHNRSASLSVTMKGSGSTEIEPNVTPSPPTSTQSVSQLTDVMPRRIAPKVESWTMPFTFKCIGTFRGHGNGIFSMVAKGQRLYSGSRDATIRVWDMDALKRGCIHTLQGHTNTIHSLVIGIGCLFSAGADLSIRSWKLESLEENKVVENAHDNIVSALVVAGPHLFSAALAQVKVWKAATLEHLYTITGLNHWVRALAVGDRKEKVYSGSHNTIHVWETSGEFSLCGKLDTSYGSVYSLAVTRQYIIAGTYNQNLHVYDINTHQHIRALMGHISTITSLTVSLSGRYLFSSSIDTTVQLWNLENMLPIQSLKRHEGAVNAIVLHHDYLLTASDDHEIKIFRYFKM